MNEVLLTSPTGEVFVLYSDGTFYLHQYDNTKYDFATAANCIRKWVEAEGWNRVFEPGWHPLTIADITSFPYSL